MTIKIIWEETNGSINTSIFTASSVSAALQHIATDTRFNSVISVDIV